MLAPMGQGGGGIDLTEMMRCETKTVGNDEREGEEEEKRRKSRRKSRRGRRRRIGGRAREK